MAEKRYNCPNCQANPAESDLGAIFPDISYLLERIEPGGTVPSAECPACGALIYEPEEVIPMMRNREDFNRIVREWLDGLDYDRIDTYGFEDIDEDQLWQRLGLQDYAERLYMLCRDDFRGTAKEMGINISEADEDFWRDVQKGIESGLECWSEVAETAIHEAMANMEEHICPKCGCHEIVHDGDGACEPECR